MDKENASKVKKLFKLTAESDLGFKQISKKASKWGLKTAYGRLFRSDDLRRILENPFYYGWFYYGGDFYQGKHEPLVTKKLFDQVQEALGDKARPTRPNKSKKQFAFTSLLKCGECGMAVTAEVQKKHYKTTGTTQKFIYYHCTRKNKRLKCKQPFIRQSDLDKQLSKLIKSVSLEPDWVEKIYEWIERDKNKQTQSIRNLEPRSGFEPETPNLPCSCSGQLSYLGIDSPLYFSFSN